jgi:hypothetical protein
VTTTLAPVSGPTRFARFAFPPNRLGYCGPGDGGDLAHYASGHDDPGLREVAAGFDGAYPYLQLLAGAAGRPDPLDADVVEAYWIGNGLLDEVELHDFGNSIDDRFRMRAGTAWHRLSDAIPAGVAHHSFHVMHVMPWAGLMRDGVVDEPLRIIDRCRISWATVVGPADGVASGTTDRVLVRRLPLVWSGSRLVWGEPVVETVQTSIIVQPGDAVAVHWDWICERLDVDQLAWLRRVTNRQLADVHAG